MSLTIIDVCSLGATIVTRFFGVMSIFTLAKTKIIPGYKINMHLRKINCQLMKRQTFPSEPVCNPVPISHGHAFTEDRSKQPGFVYPQKTELDFYQNK
jgi:hypothetical protein